VGTSIGFMVRVVAILWLFVGTVGCETSLPEPESPAAQLYRQRCSGCHRLYTPKIMTTHMWVFMVSRMEQEFQRRGLPPLPAEEKQIILDYLQKHSSNGAS
jgi:hypothetical protein